MQCPALMCPIVGTGIERYVAKDSRVLITAEGEGEVVFVDSTKITIKYDRTDEERLVSMDDDYKTYYLTKYARTNQNTSINIKPTVRRGQKVHKGDVITQGYGTQNGDLALGRNLKVAFMPWKGYNYEDAIVISERIVKEDLFTSIHVEARWRRWSMRRSFRQRITRRIRRTWRSTSGRLSRI